MNREIERLAEVMAEWFRQEGWTIQISQDAIGQNGSFASKSDVVINLTALAHELHEYRP